MAELKAIVTQKKVVNAFGFERIAEEDAIEVLSLGEKQSFESGEYSKAKLKFKDGTTSSVFIPLCSFYNMIKNESKGGSVSAKDEMVVKLRSFKKNTKGFDIQFVS